MTQLQGLLPFLSSLTLGSDTVTLVRTVNNITLDARSTCNELSDDNSALKKYVNATYYSFKFIGGLDDEALTTVNDIKNISVLGNGTPGTGSANVTGTLSVTIPAGSRTATFRLDPHRCPDSTLFTSHTERPAGFKRFRTSTSGSSTTVVSIGIQSISDESGFDMSPSKKELMITYLEDPTVDDAEDPTLDDDTKANLKKGIMDAFAGNTGTGTLDLDVDGNKGKLKTAQREADKVAGMYGTEN